MLSVIIPVKNGSATIGGAIESTTHQAHEIIVVDDDSTDNLDEALSPYEIKLFRNGGPPGTGQDRNLGLEKAKGDFVLCLDADDRLGDNQLSVLLAVIQESGADMAWCPTLLKFHTRREIIFPQDWLEFFFSGECLPMHSMLFRRDKIPFFDPTYSFEDREWQSRVLVSGMKAVPVEGTCCLYDWNGPKERYVNFRDDRLVIRERMLDWLGKRCPSQYAHANLYGCLQETFLWGLEVPGRAIHLLARAFALLPEGVPNRNDPFYQEIIWRASRLWHGIQEHPLLEKTLAHLPKPDRKRRQGAFRTDHAFTEIRKLAERLFTDTFAPKPVSCSSP